jgi:hypothetical protein
VGPVLDARLLRIVGDADRDQRQPVLRRRPAARCTRSCRHQLRRGDVTLTSGRRAALNAELSADEEASATSASGGVKRRFGTQSL